MPILKVNPQLKIIRDMAKQRKVSAFIVGGFLRDYVILQKDPKFDPASLTDFDFAIERDALKFAKSFAKKIKGAFVLLDESCGCARVCKKIRGNLYTFDFADFRAKTFKQDLSNRDFTINTLSVDLKAIDAKTEIEDVIADHKKAAVDIKAKRIRMVSAKAFKDDPLRMLRAFSIKATLGFKIEQKTLAKIKADKNLISDVSKERVRDELFKILASDRGASVLKEMDRCGLLEKIIPQIRVMYNCKQGTYHHLDVWPHSLETVVQMEGVFKQLEDNNDVNDYINESLAGERTRRDIMKLACLLHDIGKPDTRIRKNGHVSFHGHEHVGKQITRSIATMLKLSTKERFALENMVRWHLRPGYLSNFKKPSDRAIYRYFRDTRDESVSILLLSLADQRSTRGPATTESDQRHHENICLKLVDRYFEKQREQPFVRLINGDDLKKRLKLQPSPLFGRILTELDEKQSLGKFKTKKEGLLLAKQIAAESN